MSRPEHSVFESWLRGGQTVGHTFEMTLEVLIKLVRFVFLPLAIPCVWLVGKLTDARSQNASVQALLAHLFAWFGPPAPQVMVAKLPGGGEHRFAVQSVDQDPLIAAPAHGFATILGGAVLMWLGLSVILSLFINHYFFAQGREKVRERQIRGQQAAELGSLVGQIEAFNIKEAHSRGLTAYAAPKIAGVPYPFGSER